MPDPDRGIQPALHRSLGLRDLVLFGVACIVGTRWLSTAAHTGPGSVTLFLLAGLFFVVPLSNATGTLARLRPQAGGHYVWTRADFGEWHGFISFWFYWIGIACWFPNAAISYMSMCLYAIDPALAQNRFLVVGVSLAAIWIGMGANIAGVRIGKWIQNAGGIATWSILALLCVVAAAVWMKRGPVTELDIRPPLGWATVNFWSQIAFALTGLELMAMMGGEIRDPERNIPRAGRIAGLASVIIYSTATLALLVLLRPADISIIFGLVQGAANAGAILGLPWLPVVFAVLSLATAMGQFGGLGSGTSRLAYAAAVDGLMPRAFARIHPKWRTPHVSMLALTGLASFLLLIMQLGDTMNAAYQELVSMMVLGSFVPYLYIFSSAWKAGLRVSPISGIVVTLIAIVFSAAPTEEITNIWLYEAKILGGTAALVLAGRWLFLSSRKSNA